MAKKVEILGETFEQVVDKSMGATYEGCGNALLAAGSIPRRCRPRLLQRPGSNGLSGRILICQVSSITRQITPPRFGAYTQAGRGGGECHSIRTTSDSIAKMRHLSVAPQQSFAIPSADGCSRDSTSTTKV
jgi:hypothetical protein